MKNDSFVLGSKPRQQFGPALLSGRPKTGSPARPSFPRARRPHPGRNLGLGREFSLARSPAWAESRPAQSEPSDGDRRLRVDFAPTKPPGRGLRPETLGHSAFSSLCLHRSLSSQRSLQPRATESETATMAPPPAPSPACALPRG